ncbi:hypothetical protein DIPPA_09465 [Diplonema papillatum]|nr:hypothetical protein DIPPA_09465 [Diplonema papillatum]
MTEVGSAVHNSKKLNAPAAVGAREAAEAADSEAALACRCEVVRVGEIFAELGYARPPAPLTAAEENEAAAAVTSWELAVVDDEKRTCFWEQMKAGDGARRSKVVKLHAGKLYTFTTRVYAEAKHEWGPPASGRFRMLNEVTTACTSIGEDHVALRWDRPPPPVEPLNTPERDPALSAAVRGIDGYALRILRDHDMHTEYEDEFEQGTRAHTVAGLAPGYRYVVLACWNTLFGKKKTWQEALRFETQPAYELRAEGVGEDYLALAWARQAPFHVRERGGAEEAGLDRQDWKAGERVYQKSTAQPLEFELVVEGGGRGMLSDPIELHSAEMSHTLANLIPATEYTIRVRGLSTRGRWGPQSAPLKTRTVSMVAVSVVNRGEHFAQLRVLRGVKGDAADDTCYRINVLGIGHSHNFDQCVGREQIEADAYNVVVGDLRPGMRYKAFGRACRGATSGAGEKWGLWGEGAAFTTQELPAVACTERGEDFITVSWTSPPPADADAAGPLPTAAAKKTVYQINAFRTAGPGATELSTEDDNLDRPPPGAEEEADGGGEGETGDNDAKEDGVLAFSGEYVGESAGFRIAKLSPETRYRIKVRTVHTVNGAQCFGLWSVPVVMTTLRPVKVDIADIGEDFVQLSWCRAIHTSAALADIPGGHPKKGTWYDLKYEVVLGCVDSGEDRVRHKELLRTSYRIANLVPNTTYSVAVRACDDKEQWGLWCTMYFRTLSAVALRSHEVGEDFARVIWERENVGPASGRVNAFKTDAFVARYRLLLYAAADPDADGEGKTTPSTASSGNQHTTANGPMDPQDTQDNPESDGEDAKGAREDDAYPAAVGSKFVVDKFLDPSHTSFRFAELAADTPYAVVVRAATKTGVWGLWSEPLRFRTVPPFTIPAADLSIGENYIHFVWTRDDGAALADGVLTGDYTVTSQQLRIEGVDTKYSFDRVLPAAARDMKVYGLRPASAYSIRIRSCNSSGEWGTWSKMVLFKTRATIVMRVLEVAESYIIVRWERKKTTEDERGYPSGKGHTTRYLLRVTGDDDFSFDAELSEGASPYRINGLAANKRYRVVVKANYNDDEWGLWSTPLECLTLKLIDIRTLLIGEEFVNIRWTRPAQSREIPSLTAPAAARNADQDTDKESEPVFCFGQHRPFYQLRVTTRDAGPSTVGQLSWDGIHRASDPNFLERTDTDDAEMSDGLQTTGAPTEPEMKIVLETEVHNTSEEVLYTVPNMKPDTVYALLVRSRIEGGSWGVWSKVQKLITLKPNVITFTTIGEDFARLRWERPQQDIRDSKVAKGRGMTTKSQVKIRSPTGLAQTYDVDNALTTLAIQDYRPATTYCASVRTFNDGHSWGLWSPDKAFRTVSGLVVDFDTIGEDFVSFSWARGGASAGEEHSVMTSVSTDTSVSRYQIKCIGGDGFVFSRESPGDASRALSLRGLVPSGVYEIAVRGYSRSDVWGQWARLYFQTLGRLELSFCNVGEQFAELKWHRQVSTRGDGGAGLSVTRVEATVSKYRLRIMELGNPATTKLYDLPADCTSFKVTGLSPNKTYSVWVASCSTQGHWGLWSADKRVQTLPPLYLSISDIGEAYASVEWARHVVAGQDGQPGEADGDGPISTYLPTPLVEEFHVKVEGRQGVVVERQLAADVNCCKVEGLDVDTIYQVTVRMKDAKGEWGLWSAVRRFATLRPVTLSIDRIGEDFVHLQWGRRENTKTEDTERQLSSALEEEEEDEEDEEHEEGEEEEAEKEGEVTEFECNVQDVFEENEAGAGIAVGSDEVLRWIVRVYTSKISWGDNHSEFELSAEDLSKRITQLEPNTTYTFSVRALSDSGHWGFWSKEQVVTTLPLITTDITYIGEDFIVVNWDRPKTATHASFGRLSVFPLENEVHTYQLSIIPVVDDPSTLQSPEDALERDFDVSQLKYEVWDMRPGSTYRVGVREKDREGNWGLCSEKSTVQTLNPMGLTLEDLGECFCKVQWGRVPRVKPPPPDVIQSRAEPSMYQVNVQSIEVDRSGVVGSAADAFQTVQSFRQGDTEWSIKNLCPNKTYSIKARCQTDKEYWGAWSEVLMIATTKMLTIAVEGINEDSVVCQWNRESVDWLMEQDGSASSPSSARSDGTDKMSSTMLAVKPVESSSLQKSPDQKHDTASDHGSDVVPSANLGQIKTGNYEVTSYELKLCGLGHDSSATHLLPSHVSSFRVRGLQPNKIYGACVRSRNSRSVWSLWSQKVSFLTLNTISVSVSRVTECFMWVHWKRDPQCLEDFADVLAEESEREDERDRRGGLKGSRKALGEGAAEGELSGDRDLALDENEGGDESDFSGLFTDSNAGGESGDTAGLTELKQKSKEYLHLHNVHTASTECTGYHFRLWGDTGCPTPPPPSLCIPLDDPFSPTVSERRSRKPKNTPRKVKEGKSLKPTHSTVGRPQLRAQKKAKGAKKKTDKADTASSGQAEADADADPSLDATLDEVETLVGDDEADRCLLDAQVRKQVLKFKIENLTPDTLYTVAVRPRNTEGEWGIWSEALAAQTLLPLQLCNSRFGEHYINLFWFRLSKERADHEQQQELCKKEYEANKKQIEEREKRERDQTERDNVQYVRQEPSAEAKERMRKELKVHKARVRELRETAQTRKEGKGLVFVPPEVKVEKFLLRVVSEDGKIDDVELPALDGKDQPILNMYTVSNLVPNHLYVVRLMLCYAGGEWGDWSGSTKFMTQNLLQLSISYVGESFIQLDWKRAPNVRIKGEDMSRVQTTPTEQGLGHHYQIRLDFEAENKMTGQHEERKQSVDVVDTNSFRVTGLVSDLKYTLAVREWDRKGDWGLWSPQRTCMTLSRMVAAICDIGEDWIEVAWERMKQRIRYDDPAMVSMPVSVTAYYLDVEELDDNDLPEDEERRRMHALAIKAAEEALASPGRDDDKKDKHDSNSDTDSTTDEEDQMAVHRKRQRKKELEDRQRLAELEAAVAASEKGVIGPDGRYRMTLKLAPTVSSLRIDNLKSNRFCNIRVQAETSGNELGVWSPDCFFVTMKRMSVDVELVGEDNFTVTWNRPPNRKHPRLPTVYEGDTTVVEYEAEVLGKGSASGFQARKPFPPTETMWRITGLALDSLYAFRVRSKDCRDRWSLWNLPMEVVTLMRMAVGSVKTTEQMMVVQWGRPKQRAEDYPQKSQESQLVISQERTMQFHLRVWSNDDRKTVLVDRTFVGSVTRYTVHYLTPNSTYYVECRACNAAGEWGAWSSHGTVRTMQLLCLDVKAVGENYVNVRWWRHAPDAGAAAAQAPILENTNANVITTHYGGLGEPVRPEEPREDEAFVFTAPETRIDKYELTISLLGSEQEWESTVIVPNTDNAATSFTITDLVPDKRYRVSIRASYEDETWGTTSQTVATATLNVLSVEAYQVGEDYIKTKWHRLPHTYRPQPGDPQLHLGQLEATIRWQYRVSDITIDATDPSTPATPPSPGGQSVLTAPGGLTAGRLHAVGSRLQKGGGGKKEGGELARDSKGNPVVVSSFTGETAVTLRELVPNHRYRVEVRHWYIPVDESYRRAKEAALKAQSKKTKHWFLPNEESETQQQQPSAVEDITDEADAEKTNEEEQPASPEADAAPAGTEGQAPEQHEDPYIGEPGIWGSATHVATLKPMVAIIDEIAEDYFSLRWIRDPDAHNFHPSSVADLVPDVQGYHVVIDQLHADGTEKDMAENTVHIDHEFGPDETAFRVTNLTPATCYKVFVRAIADNEWGLWSQPCVLITLPKLSISINNIGEDYVVISWDRFQKQLEINEALVGTSSNVSRYHVEMHGVDQPYHLAKKFKASRTSYKVKRLDVSSMYTVRVRSCDAGNTWSLWSEQACFVTLRPITVTFGKIAEQFVHVEWTREKQHATDYNHSLPPVLPEAAVTKYHLCVFAAEHAPSVPLVDKQFSGDVTNFKVANLSPNSMYIVIVRAANTEQQWGSWSEERTAITLPLLTVKVDSIGENYVMVGWGRDEASHNALQSGIVVPSKLWHVVLTSHELQYEKRVTAEALAETNGLFSVRNLKPDTKYILTLRACYGDEEWGLWTSPVTFLTLNQLGLTVSNISEDKADVTWGRGMQSAQHTYDPNLIVWKGLVAKYSLLIKKVVPLGASDEDTEEPLCLEREMELNKYKYIQTYCTTEDLSVDTEYIVKVRAQDDRGEWGEWTELSFETPPYPPGKPILRKAHTNYIMFDWEPPDTLNRYLYCVEQAVSKVDRMVKKDERGSAVDGNLDWKVVDTVGDPNAKIKTTAALTKCRFRVKCCKIDKPVHLWSSYSPVAAFTTATPPDAVSNLCITSLSKSSATLEWVRPPPPPNPPPQSRKADDKAKTIYKVLLGEKDGPTQFVGMTKSCRYELTELKPNVHYRVQVQVETDSGISVRNSVLKFSTRADAAAPEAPAAAAQAPRRSTKGRFAVTAPAGGPTTQSSSSDTTGHNVRLPVLSPPRTAPLQPLGLPLNPAVGVRPPDAPAAAARAPRRPTKGRFAVTAPATQSLSSDTTRHKRERRADAAAPEAPAAAAQAPRRSTKSRFAVTAPAGGPTTQSSSSDTTRHKRDVSSSSEKDGPTQFVGMTKSCRYELTELKPNVHYRVQVQVETDSGISVRNSVLKFSTRADAAAPEAPAAAAQAPRRSTKGRFAVTAPAGGPTTQSSSSDTTGHNVRLPVLSPPRTAPLQPLGLPLNPAVGVRPPDAPPPGIRAPLRRSSRDGGVPAIDSAARALPHPPQPPDPRAAGQSPQQVHATLQDEFFDSGMEAIDIHGSDGQQASDQRSHASDEDYDVLSIQHSDETDP